MTVRYQYQDFAPLPVLDPWQSRVGLSLAAAAAASFRQALAAVQQGDRCQCNLESECGRQGGLAMPEACSGDCGVGDDGASGVASAWVSAFAAAVGMAAVSDLPVSADADVAPAQLSCQLAGW